MKQILDKIKALDPKYAPMIVGAILALFLVLDFFLLMQPQLAWMTKTAEKAAKLQGEIGALKSNKQRITQFQNQLKQASDDLRVFEQLVYTKDKVPGVLRQVSSFAKEYGIKIDEMVPQPISEKSIVKNDDGQYFGQDIFLRGQAGYHEFGAFLNRLEKENIVWIIENFVIKGNGDTIYQHGFNMKIKLLVLEKA